MLKVNFNTTYRTENSKLSENEKIKLFDDKIQKIINQQIPSSRHLRLIYYYIFNNNWEKAKSLFILFFCNKFILIILYLEELEPLIFQIPTDLACYDWTFKIGASTYSKKDYNVICKQNLSNNNDNDNDNNEDNDINDNKNDENGPGYNERKKPSYVPSSWLLITNSKGFILGMTITPGILTNINFCCVENVNNFRLISHIFYIILL